MVPTADESSFDYFQQEHEITLYSKASTPVLMYSHSPIQWIPRAPFLMLKWRRREAKQLTPPNAKVKNACYNSTYTQILVACIRAYL